MGCGFDVLVLDLDGTLLGPDGRVSQRNAQAVAAARRAGLQVIIATGRALIESMRALRAIEHEGLVVAAGGSILCDAASGRTLRRMPMPREVVERVVRSLLRHGHKALVLKDAHATGYDYLAVGEAELNPVSRWWFDHLQVEVRFAARLEDDPHPGDSVRAGTVALGSELGAVAGELREDLGEEALLQHWSAVTERDATGSATHLLEVFHPRVSKWTMIAESCREAGIEPARIAAIGDEINDVEMIRSAGLGIAMANAVPAVKAVSDRVTAGYDSDGVAMAIEHILAGEWRSPRAERAT
jgi:hypothetical protein